MVRLLLAVLGMAILMLAGLPGPALGGPCAAGFISGSAALLSGWADDKPGLCRQIRPSDIVPPSKSNSNHSQIIPVPAGALPKVPPGFRVSSFHRGPD